ncbi:unnamed protein product [Ophioblennius macclurei]
MKSHTFLLLVALYALGCTGAPLRNPELQSAAGRGLGQALAEVNSVYATSHLYRVTQGSVSKVIPMGMNTADLLIKFGIKETVCAKDSGNDPQACDFKPGFFVASSSCSARVRITTTSSQVISLRCGPDGSSSSSESSEEVHSRGRQHFVIPTVIRATTPAPQTLPDQSRRSQTEDIQRRGDTFSNFLV